MNRLTRILLAPGFISSAWAIEDPKRDFLQEFAASDKADLVATRLDLNADGTLDWLLSTSDQVNGQQGNMWVLYLSDGEAFRRVDEVEDGTVIEFHQKAAAVEEREDGTGSNIIRYSRGGSDHGMLTTWEFSSEGVTHRVIREVRPGTDDIEFYRALFLDETKRPVYQVQNVAQAREELGEEDETKDFFANMNLVKWCLVVIGGFFCIFLILFVLRLLMSLLGAGKKKKKKRTGKQI